MSRGPAALVRHVVGSLFQHRTRQVQGVKAVTDWRMLQAVNRINRAHWQAQQAMRAEAARWQSNEDRWSW